MGLHGWPRGRIQEGTFEPWAKAFVAGIRKKRPNAGLNRGPHFAPRRSCSFARSFS